MSSSETPLPSSPNDRNNLDPIDLKKLALNWGKRLLERNPFYLISAGLLLYGINLFSADPTFAHVETSRLSFNFSTLLIYELLLVITAVFLSRRKIWYDSLLLVALENLFVLIPFSLLSRAVFTESSLAWWMCLAGLIFAAVKFWILKYSIRQLYLPARLLAFAAIILVINAALPMVSHHFAENTPVLTASLTVGWIAVLPLLVYMFDLLPQATFRSEAPAQKYWPQILYAIWLIVTGFHLGGVGYVHTFEWQIALLTPTAWILSWMAVRRSRLLQSAEVQFQTITLCLPAVVTLLAIGYAQNKLLFMLGVLNTAIYAWLYLTRKDTKARQLAFITLTASAALFPEPWGKFLTPDSSRSAVAVASIGAYFFAWSLLSRDPRKGLAGVFTLVITMGVFLQKLDWQIHHLIQIGVVYMLLHSLRWNDENYAGSKVTRTLFAVLWFIHSVFWCSASPQPATSMISMLCAIICTLYCSSWLIFKLRTKRIIPGTALAILVTEALMRTPKLKTEMPSGFWAIVGSFVLFAVGTTVAVTKPRWSKTNSKALPKA